MAHKRTAIAGAIMLAVVAFVLIKKTGTANGETRYVLGTAELGTITASVSGSGQVTALNQVDIKPKATGEITAIKVKAGESVRKGQSLFSIDAQDAQKAVRDAEINLESAELNLESVKKNSTSDLDDKKLAVKNAYTDLLNSNLEALPVDETDLKAPTISGNYTLGKEGDITLKIYKSTGGFSFQTAGLVDDTGLVSQNTPQPIGNSGLYITFPADANFAGTEWVVHIPNKKASNYTSNYNKYQTALTDLKTAQEETGSSDLTLRSAELSVQQRENDLLDARQTLSNYSITAPFDGVIASVDAELGQSTSSGTSLATIITDKKIASISLNEVDVAKIHAGDRATITFDAIDDLSITGEVAQIDTLGTVSQGVVSYNVSLAFDTQDERVKPGMSVSATITSETKTDVLIVPNSAVKSGSSGSYVLTLPGVNATAGQPVQSAAEPAKVPVEVGLSNDSDTEILSGLAEGDMVVVRTVSATATATSTRTAAPSLIGGGGGVRIQQKP